MKPRALDLFSGIGGFSLGLERAGMQTVAFCEIDPFCRRVLANHWPAVPCYDDIRHLTGERVAADGIAVDVICGGFPCQDISSAGRGAGIDGARSGLWREFARLIGELRPRLVLVENVSRLRSRGLGRVLGDLAALGFDAEWHCIPASAVGAPHIRDRVWILAEPQHPYADELGSHRTAQHDGSVKPEHQQGRYARSLGALLADACEQRLSTPERQAVFGARRRQEGRAVAERSGWSAEPAVGRVAQGVPARVDRLRTLGNAIVPQVAEFIGRAALAHLQTKAA